nr:hypothetical protein [Cytophagaceae bacterium]
MLIVLCPMFRNFIILCTIGFLFPFASKAEKIYYANVDSVFEIKSATYKDLEKILKWKTVMFIHIWDYQDDSLPNALVFAKELRHFSVTGGKLRVLPEEWGRLYELETFRIDSCPLEEIPADLFGMKSLDFLEINNTKVSK